eukprot:TRINITY_DN17963_c0_g1_i1.p1 TRINITY_DN17963_c0_g1~~TRINITY_DN17963_c0_g1_i1.p1  ORF type:complete len:397 (+),score=34.39 TRINITY_DN17963_c0_g1_i1:91-1281(+)
MAADGAVDWDDCLNRVYAAAENLADFLVHDAGAEDVRHDALAAADMLEAPQGASQRTVWTNVFNEGWRYGVRFADYNAAIQREPVVVLPGRPKKEVVLMLPWAFSRWRQYRSIVAWWQALGHTVVLCRQCECRSVSDTFAASRCLLDTLCAVLDEARPTRRFIAHVFSLNGAGCFGRMVQEALEPADGKEPVDLLDHLATVVFDSAPIPVATFTPPASLMSHAQYRSLIAIPQLVARAADIGDPSILPRVYALGVLTRVMAMAAAGVGRCDFWLDVAAADTAAIRWATVEWPSLAVTARVPHLFIYSDEDAVFPADQVEQAALIIRTGGVAESPEGVMACSHHLGDRLKSKLRFFEGSHHCAHFQRYTEEYKRELMLWMSVIGAYQATEAAPSARL